MENELKLNVRLRREFAAPVSRVFEAWQDPAFITRWWKNLSVAQLDFREGGEYRFEWDSFEGHVAGVYKSIKANKEIVFTWTSDPSPEGCGESIVRIHFEALDAERTLLVIEHDLNQSVEEDRMHHQGWMAALADLADELPRLNSAVVVERDVAAPVNEVYRALTEGGMMQKWFFTRCETDAREGGEYKIDWASEQAPERNHTRFGRYLKVVPNERLEFEWGGLELDKNEPSTRVSLTLARSETGTRLRLEHVGFGDSDAWTESRDQHERGWEFYMANLDRVLTGGPDLRVAGFGQTVIAA